ncbi:MAG: hypothetical protein AB1502_01755 [Thermodesulfobacteriota bacterium]
MIDAPIWNIGDKWTYKSTTGVIWTNEVVEVKEDSYVLKMRRSKNLYGFDKRTMNVKYIIKEGSKGTENIWGASGRFLDFPVVVGREWCPELEFKRFLENRLHIIGEPIYLSRFKIEDVEEVTVPAGTLKSYATLFRRMRTRNEALRGSIRLWYSPEVKTWIKIVIENGSFWIDSARRTKDVFLATILAFGSAELISYESK